MKGVRPDAIARDAIEVATDNTVPPVELDTMLISVSVAASLALVLAQDMQGNGPMRVTPGRGPVCARILNMYECATAIERHLLPAVSSVASRSEEGLCFQTDETQECFADMRGDDPLLYSYVGSLPSPYLHVLWVISPEYHEVLLVDGHTGTTVVVDDIPVVSPNGSSLAVASRDLIAGWVPNRLSIWQMMDGKLEMVWSITPSDWGPGTPVWRDDKHFSVARWESHDFVERQTGTMTVSHRGDTWNVTHEP